MSTRMMKDARDGFDGCHGGGQEVADKTEGGRKGGKQGSAQGCQEETAYDPEKGEGDGTPEIGLDGEDGEAA